MLLDINPVSPAERSSETPAPNEVRRRGAAPASPYSRVMDEVSAGDDKVRGAANAKTGKPFSLWEKPDFSFGDFLDIINPLQHIPIVSTIYRNLSGDQIGAVPRVIGGALWGRLGGLVTGVINSVVEWFTGKDIGDHIYSAIWGDSPNAVAQVTDKPELQAERSVNLAEPTAKAPAVVESEPKIVVEELHSALTPTEIISSRFLDAYHRRVKESEDAGNKPQVVRVSA
ncbi:MAG: hypothetical protein EXR70_23060 [Deltaproteobacteria bacterium]|nr:hypothetical protein [Deltaproteobacteria bacterium]